MQLDSAPRGGSKSYLIEGWEATGPKNCSKNEFVFSHARVDHLGGKFLDQIPEVELMNWRWGLFIWSEWRLMSLWMWLMTIKHQHYTSFWWSVTSAPACVAIVLVNWNDQQCCKSLKNAMRRIPHCGQAESLFLRLDYESDPIENPGAAWSNMCT